MRIEQRPPALDVDRLLDDPRTRIIVCCGSGGVGKTTTAAALGVRAAERGRHVVVLTVDPARRLAQGGLQLGGIMINMVRPQDLPEDQLQAAAAGRLDEHELDLGLKDAGIEDRRGLASSLGTELTEHAREALAQRAQRARLAEADQPHYELPLITSQMDLAGLYQLAAALREQGAA